MKKSKSITVFIDGNDFNWHLGEDSDPQGARVYNTSKDVKRHHKCWPECGVVEATLTFKRYETKPQLFKDLPSAYPEPKRKKVTKKKTKKKVK